MGGGVEGRSLSQQFLKSALLIVWGSRMNLPSAVGYAVAYVCAEMYRIMAEIGEQHGTLDNEYDFKRSSSFDNFMFMWAYLPTPTSIRGDV